MVHERSGTTSTTGGAAPGVPPALAEAVGLTGRAVDGVRAAGDVRWGARAADLYRAEAAEVLHGLVQDRLLLDDVVRQANVAPVAGSPAVPAGGPW